MLYQIIIYLYPQVFDRNKDGYVVADEIRYVMKSLGHNMSEAEIDGIIKEGDTNGDGRLDYHGKPRAIDPIVTGMGAVKKRAG